MSPTRCCTISAALNNKTRACFSLFFLNFLSWFQQVQIRRKTAINLADQSSVYSIFLVRGSNLPVAFSFWFCFYLFFHAIRNKTEGRRKRWVSRLVPSLHHSLVHSLARSLWLTDSLHSQMRSVCYHRSREIFIYLKKKGKREEKENRLQYNKEEEEERECI